jgi:hypothetical protein
MAVDGPWAPLPRPRFARPRLVSERAAIARLELAVAARVPADPVPIPPERQLAAVTDPWPELPPHAVHDEADHDATLRALARERRLHDEQGRL